jgi:hypothetical protein
MDPRLQSLLARQQATRFADLSGSDVRVTLRASAALLNEAVAAYAAAAPVVREISVTPRASNRFDVHLKLRKAFVPSLHLTLVIEQQPQVPVDAALVLRVTGAGGLVRIASGVLGAFGGLPSGVRMDGEHLIVDLRTVLRGRAEAQLLDLADRLEVTTEEGTAILNVHVRVP